MRTGSFSAMGSKVTWWADSDAGDLIGAWFEDVERTCSRFRPDSELSLLNSADDERIEVTPLLLEVLVAADRAVALSDGFVDPTLLDSVVAAGYDDDFDRASRRRRSAPPRVHGWRDVRFEVASVRRPKGLKLDLGGIAKGWAAWKALELIEGPCVVDAAGDLAIRGTWSVEVEHGGARVARLAVESGGVATSGIDRRRWKDGHHIIDPRTMEPSTSDVIAATVVADTTADAEMLARTLVVLGSWEGLGFAEDFPGVRGALVTKKDGVTVALPQTMEVLA